MAHPSGTETFYAPGGDSTVPGAASAGTDSLLVSAQIDFSSVSEVAQLGFVVHCTNVPAWSQVAFSCAAPNNGGPDFLPIALPWVSVPVPAGGKRGDIVGSFGIGIQTRVIANYQSGLYFQYRSNGYPTPPNFTITMQVLLITGEGILIIGSSTMQLAEQN